MRGKDLSHSFEDIKEGRLPVCSERHSFRVWASPGRCLNHLNVVLRSLHVLVYQM